MAPPPTSGSIVSGARVFEILWNDLVAVLGTAATATLVRRAALRGATRVPELRELTVDAAGLEYRYTLPPAWADCAYTALPSLRELVHAELSPLLREFSGNILLRRLGRVPELRALGVCSTGVE